MLKVKKLHENAVIPDYQTEGAAGMDLVATDIKWDNEIQCWIYSTGIAVEIPVGCEGQVRSRSSIRKYDLILANGVGTIDSDYRGEIIVSFKELPSTNDSPKVYEIGDRIAQLVISPVKKFHPYVVEELSNTERGEGSHGSTGT